MTLTHMEETIRKHSQDMLYCEKRDDSTFKSGKHSLFWQYCNLCARIHIRAAMSSVQSCHFQWSKAVATICLFCDMWLVLDCTLSDSVFMSHLSKTLAPTFPIMWPDTIRAVFSDIKNLLLLPQSSFLLQSISHHLNIYEWKAKGMWNSGCSQMKWLTGSRQR